MAYERAKFGDGSASGAGNVTTAVNQHFGPFNTGKTVGTFDTDGAIREMLIDLDGTMVSNEAFPLLAPELPAYCKVIGVYVEVEEVFALGGTSPAVSVGTEGSESTNGFDISEAQLEALGVYDVTGTLAGTWAAGLTAATTVGIDLTGTTPTSTSAGKARLVIRYVKV